MRTALPVRSNDADDTYPADAVAFGARVKTSCPPTWATVSGALVNERYQSIDCVPVLKSSVMEEIGHHLPAGVPPPLSLANCAAPGLVSPPCVAAPSWIWTCSGGKRLAVAAWAWIVHVAASADVSQ